MATLAEAWPLWKFHPWVTGMARRNYNLPAGCYILSAGFAGACKSELSPGDVLLIGTQSQAVAEMFRGDSGQALSPGTGREVMARVSAGALRTVNTIATPEEKRQLGLDGIDGVDMETWWLSQAARRQGLPFLGVRVIIDRLDDSAISFSTALHYPIAARRLRQAVRTALALWP